jgi:hypothetical protein
MAAPSFESIQDALWPRGLSSRMSVFVILDSARDDRIFGIVDGTRLPKDCLYSGDLPWQMQMIAPYLVQLERDDRFTRTVLTKGWGDSWGCFLRCDVGIKQLRRHLRQFLRVRDEAGTRLIFRYYDPRVLRIYLPTCLPQENETFFGPIDSYLTEGESGEELLEFRHQGGRLTTKSVNLTA